MECRALAWLFLYVLGAASFDYELLSYSKTVLFDRQIASNERLIRSRRAIGRRSSLLTESTNPIYLSFYALKRPFHLRLWISRKHVFSEDFYVQGSEGCFTLSQMTSDSPVTFLKGHLVDKPHESEVYGYARDGVFFGRIKDRIEDKTFYVDNVERLNLTSLLRNQPAAHSVIYEELSLFPLSSRYGGNQSEEEEIVASSCAYHGATKEMMDDIQHTHFKSQDLTSKSVQSDLQNRIRRSSQTETSEHSIYSHNTCLLSITSDHLFTEQYSDASVVTAEIANFVSELNSIFEQLVFLDGTKGYGFAIAKITIEDQSSLQRPDYKYKDPYIGVEKLLDLVSTEDHSEYCLAYLFTARDFMKGVLGLAWVAGDSASGGICETYKMHQNGQKKSLNTGVITTVNYGQPVATRVSHLTFTHEVGHNWGSPHDFPPQCKPGGQQGNYIMFASATSADKPNNNKFSNCSVANMTHILLKRRDKCFKEADRAICGNMVVDEGEECDCGFESNCLSSGDQCCNPADSPQGCTLKAGVQCSPTQGPCCTDECQLVTRSENKLCQSANECVMETYCDGQSVKCVPEKKDNLTDCNGGQQVCIDGVCAGSQCLKHDMVDCLCEDANYLCDLCCQMPQQPETCQSSGVLDQFDFFKKMRPIGSPCNDFNGYCDAFNRCMAIDSNGPLSRLRDAIFNPEVYKDIFQWAKAHWWLTVLICVTSTILFILFVKVFSVHTPSSNPNLPKNRHLRDTVSTLPRTIRRSTSSAARSRYQAGLPVDHPTAVLAAPPAHSGARVDRTGRERSSNRSRSSEGGKQRGRRSRQNVRGVPQMQNQVTDPYPPYSSQPSQSGQPPYSIEQFDLQQMPPQPPPYSA